MPICSTCGAPDHMRCNCVVEPYCDQCDENDACNSEMDSACVIYHPTYPGFTPLPSQLITLALSNGSSAQTIFEAIDDYLGDNVNTPLVPVDTNSIDLTASGVSGHTLRADLKVSSDFGNQLSIHSNGVYAAPYNDTYQVKVDEDAAPRYLDTAIIGGTDGCVSISTDVQAGLLLLQPTLDLQCFADRICSTSDEIKQQLSACIITAGLNIEDTDSVDLTLASIGAGLQLSADVKISATGGNTLSINADGLYSAGGTAGASNGLDVDGSNVVLGQDVGESGNPAILLSDREIPMGGFNLAFTNPSITINSTTNPALTYMYGQSLLTTKSVITSSQIITQVNNSFAIAVNSGVTLDGGATLTVDSSAAGAGNQIYVRPTADISFVADPKACYAGSYNSVIKYGASNVSNNDIVGGFFIGLAGDTGNVSDMSAIKIAGVYNPPTGLAANFTGTITNFCGIKITDISGSTLGANITNKFAILQQGASDISRFFGPVQNASSSVQFTSDKRVKENIQSFTRGLAEINKIDTITFNYLWSKDRQSTGLIAQELEQIIPEAVAKGNFEIPNGAEYSDFRMVDQTVLFYAMLNAIKELSVKVTALENK